MAKHLGAYADQAAANTALQNLEITRPYVIYTTGATKEVFYGPYEDLSVIGDIVVYNVSADVLNTIHYENYNTTSYPTAQYVPIGVVMQGPVDSLTGATGLTTFMGLNWLDASHPDTGNTSRQALHFGYNNYDIPGLTNYSNSGTATTDFNGKNNTNIILEYATAQTDWRTASTIQYSASTAGYYPLFECAWRYHTSGTSQGDWYVPSCGELWNVVSSSTKIDIIDATNTLLGRSNDKLGRVRFGTSTEKNSSNAWSLKDGSYPNCYFTDQSKSSNYDFMAKPFCQALTIPL